MNGQRKTGLERVIIMLFALIAVLIVAIGALAFFYYGSTPAADNVFIDVLGQRIEFVPGLTIDGVAVGNLTVEEARPLVKAAKIEPLGKLIIRANGETAELDLSSLTPERDYEATIQKAILIGNEGERDERKAVRTRIETNGEHIETPLHYDATPLRDAVEKIAAQLSIEPQDASVHILTPDEREKRGFAVDASAIIATEVGTVHESLQSLLETVPEVPGSKVDVDALMVMVQKSIDEGSSEAIEAQTVPVEPTVKLDEIDYDLIEVSRASSSFAKSPYNASSRMANISKAAELINGYVLLPGEEFSCNTVIGPRTTSRGWKEAGAIRDGKSVQETGGGICQVSSTLFNAVLKADLKIVDRSPHSWPLSYIPAGQDATISTGGPDFVFANNRDKPMILVVEADLDKRTITAVFYGVPLPDQDYDEVKLVTTQTSSISQPSTQYSTVKSMRAGTSNTVRQGRSGSTHETVKEYYKDGELIRTEFSHNTKYRALASIVERGPAAPAAPVQTVAPAPTTSTESSAPVEAAPPPADDDIVFDIPEE